MWLDILRKILCSQEKLDEARGDIRILQDQIDTLELERDIMYESPYDVSDE